MATLVCTNHLGDAFSSWNGGVAMAKREVEQRCIRSPSTIRSSAVEEDTMEVVELQNVTVAVPPQPSLPKMSIAIPFLKRPEHLTGQLAGDFGFDPLNFAKDKETLFAYREAEIKHSRLAMLAAVGWPMSELYDKKIAAFFGVEPAIDATDRAPSLWNGGLERISPVWWGFCLGLTASIDLYGVSRARAADGAYLPGDLGFDPLHLFPDEPNERARMRLAEIKHGRLAMLAVLAYSVQEAITKIGIVDETPILFQPITETVKDALEPYAN